VRKLCFVLAFLSLTLSLAAQTYDQKLFGGMRWRNVGPFRGGRVLTVAGIPGDPETYFFGAVAGGVFKSTDAGVSWKPLFDHEATSSIGAIAVSDSDHNVIYVGTGEACIRGNMSYGDGVYKSMDAGRTWQNVGLRDTQHIGAIIIDPRDSNIVLVAAAGAVSRYSMTTGWPKKGSDPLRLGGLTPLSAWPLPPGKIFMKPPPPMLPAPG